MLGATVTPHAIYLHGALTEDRYVRETEEQRHCLLRSQRVDVGSSMSIAGLVNLSMVVIAAPRSARAVRHPSRPPRARTPASAPRWARQRLCSARSPY